MQLDLTHEWLPSEAVCLVAVGVFIRTRPHIGTCAVGLLIFSGHRAYSFFSHTQRVSVTSDHPVSVVVVGVNFIGFLTSLEPLHGFASYFVWMDPY